MHANSYVGKRFGRLVVRVRSGIDNNGNATWQCECDCGKTAVVAGFNLRTLHTRSCGCLQREVLEARAVIHGYARARKATEYNSWKSAKGRCFNPNKHQYEDYGGRGIRMCNRWSHSFQAFLDDMGHKPTVQHTLDRIDNERHYSCGVCPDCMANHWLMNCRWATRKQQAQNSRPRRRKTEIVR